MPTPKDALEAKKEANATAGAEEAERAATNGVNSGAIGPASCEQLPSEIPAVGPACYSRISATSVEALLRRGRAAVVGPEQLQV